MKSFVPALFRVATVAPLALAATFGLATPANAAPVSVNWTCQGTVGGVAQTSSMTTTVDGSAPATAAAGSTVAITLTPGAVTVPSSANGFTVNSISNLQIITPTPTNSTLVSASGSGGSVAGTVAIQGTNVVETVPGPISGGSTFTPPAMNISVTAGAAGTTITTTHAGTSYTDPGMTMTVNVQTPLGATDVATSCYPSPAPTFTTTTVS